MPLTFFFFNLKRNSFIIGLHVQQTFLYISLLSLYDQDGKMPDFTFYWGCKQAMSKLSFSFSTWIWFLGIQLQEKNRDEDWKKANSLFKQLFRCRRCPLIFLYLTTPTDPGLLVWVSYGQVATQNGWHFNDAVALRKFLHLRKWLYSFCSLGRKEWGRSYGSQFFEPLLGANDKGYLLSNSEFIYWMMRQD